MLALIHYKFVGQIDALIEQNEAFIAKVNAGISQEELAACAARCIQRKNLVAISEAQNEAFRIYKVGGYMGAFGIFLAGIFGTRHGYTVKLRKDSLAP